MGIKYRIIHELKQSPHKYQQYNYRFSQSNSMQYFQNTAPLTWKKLLFRTSTFVEGKHLLDT
jgi:hypothetical protein